jgi:hypothetical protein
MSIDITALVTIDLEPVFTLDPALSTSIPDRIAAEMALQGWGISDITDARAVYIATLTTKAFIPRLLLKFAQELKKTKAAKAEAEFNDAIRYLEALQAELQDRLQRAASDVAPEDLQGTQIPWPSCGIVEW